MFDRTLKLSKLLEAKSFFLFGPRATGKSTLIAQQLPDARVYDLLDARVFGRLARRPRLIEEEHQAGRVVAIDEIQKMPSLLDEVHRLIERRGIRFLLTGSSARIRYERVTTHATLGVLACVSGSLRAFASIPRSHERACRTSRKRPG